MCVDEQIRNNGNVQRNDVGVRIDLVDNWHKNWPDVLSAIEKNGHRNALLMDHDGWLSARQCLLVAFDRDEVVGHLVFRIQPIGAERSLGAASRPGVEAHFDALGVKPGLADSAVRRLLLEAATRRAQSLRCLTLVGFEAAVMSR
jgi:ribosomal protein S18 acetylase RimI-like enzyme